MKVWLMPGYWLMRYATRAGWVTGRALNEEVKVGRGAVGGHTKTVKGAAMLPAKGGVIPGLHLMLGPTGVVTPASVEGLDPLVQGGLVL